MGALDAPAPHGVTEKLALAKDPVRPFV